MIHATELNERNATDTPPKHASPALEPETGAGPRPPGTRPARGDWTGLTLMVINGD